MHRYLILFFLLISSLYYSQELKVIGECVDKRNKTLDHVLIRQNKSSSNYVYTNSKGKFIISIKDTLQTSLILTVLDLKKIIKIPSYYDIEKKSIGKEIIYDIGKISFDFVEKEDVIISNYKIETFEIPKLPTIDAQKITGSFEKYLTLVSAATSNNELTSNYNVRGGNYDENLVYVNGFNVYRPFLTRSGQQEGMSFIHSALVESIRFSAGGFESQYGDKLSSVLDIEYKTPNKFNSSGVVSLLGVEAHVEDAPQKRFNYLAGARYRSNGYLLNALPTTGSYNPVFTDAQLLLNFELRDDLTFTFLGHYSSNLYRFQPQTQQTDFGTANEAYSFRVYFEGQERTSFQTAMGGAKLTWTPNRKIDLSLCATIFNSDEREYFDILGQYYINQLETDPSKEEYGDSIAVLGVGSFLNHARNRLNASIVNIYHNGVYRFKDQKFTDKRKKKTLKWGVNYQQDFFNDVLSEWKLVDSAGYSLPQGGQQLELSETIKSRLNLIGERYTSYFQLNSFSSIIKRNHPVEINRKITIDGKKIKKTYRDTISESAAKWAISFGTRLGHTTVNNESYITPRGSITYIPRAYLVKDGKVRRRTMAYRLSSGLYYQPPFYREYRTFNGNLNTNVLSQKSFHIVAGSDIYFNMWKRDAPFKFTGEIYYKYMWDINPYEIDNVRTRYYAENNAIGYAYGIDMNVYGQFVKGIESFFKLGLMSTKEDIQGDSYTEYYNTAGERIIFGFSDDQEVVDSNVIFPGYIPRPTDQFLTIGALVQDRMPGIESFTVQMGLQFGSRLPYGPPDYQRYKDTLRMKSYFRVDLGLSYDFLYNTKTNNNFWSRYFNQAILSFEVFNILGINNVLSKQWIQDVNGVYYSIPNYLTQRRFNIKLILRLKD